MMRETFIDDCLAPASYYLVLLNPLFPYRCRYRTAPPLADLAAPVATRERHFIHSLCWLSFRLKLLLFPFPRTSSRKLASFRA